jgi:hypothetical protein
MSAAAIALLLCALACPVGMGLMMLFMRKGHAKSRNERDDRPAEARDERGN